MHWNWGDKDPEKSLLYMRESLLCCACICHLLFVWQNHSETVQFLSLSCSFRKKHLPNNRLPHGKSWIHHWQKPALNRSINVMLRPMRKTRHVFRKWNTSSSGSLCCHTKTTSTRVPLCFHRGTGEVDSILLSIGPPPLKGKLTCSQQRVNLTLHKSKIDLTEKQPDWRPFPTTSHFR